MTIPYALMVLLVTMLMQLQLHMTLLYSYSLIFVTAGVIINKK